MKRTRIFMVLVTLSSTATPAWADGDQGLPMQECEVVLASPETWTPDAVFNAGQIINFLYLIELNQNLALAQSDDARDFVQMIQAAGAHHVTPPARNLSGVLKNLYERTYEKSVFENEVVLNGLREAVREVNPNPIFNFPSSRYAWFMIRGLLSLGRGLSTAERTREGTTVKFTVLADQPAEYRFSTTVRPELLDDIGQMLIQLKNPAVFALVFEHARYNPAQILARHHQVITKTNATARPLRKASILLRIDTSHLQKIVDTFTDKYTHLRKLALPVEPKPPALPAPAAPLADRPDHVALERYLETARPDRGSFEITLTNLEALDAHLDRLLAYINDVLIDAALRPELTVDCSEWADQPLERTGTIGALHRKITLEGDLQSQARRALTRDRLSLELIKAAIARERSTLASPSSLETLDQPTRAEYEHVRDRILKLSQTAIDALAAVDARRRAVTDLLRQIQSIEVLIADRLQSVLQHASVPPDDPLILALRSLALRESP